MAKKKKKVTNIILFDNEEEEQTLGDILKATAVGESSEENSDRSSAYVSSPSEGTLTKLNGNRNVSLLKNCSKPLNGDCGFQKFDVKSIDDEDVDDHEESYGKTLGNRSRLEDSESCAK